jgi:hypothetical protein
MAFSGGFLRSESSGFHLRKMAQKARLTRRSAFFRKPPPPPSRGSEAPTEVLEKEQLDAKIGGDYIAASADFRDGDDAENGS